VCRLKISASAVELGFEDDFWDARNSVFINGLSVMSILFAQNMSASDVELGFLDDFWVLGTSFSSTVSDAAVVCVE
jgi:ethanolamine utilization microcompartment shell protein EutS